MLVITGLCVVCVCEGACSSKVVGDEWRPTGKTWPVYLLSIGEREVLGNCFFEWSEIGWTNLGERTGQKKAAQRTVPKDIQNVRGQNMTGGLDLQK